MIHRRAGVSYAMYSDDERYRYQLTRRLTPIDQHILFVMLNPSTATELDNDPTVHRCERRALKMGFGTYTVCNLFAFRNTFPLLMTQQKDPVGPDNDKIIRQCAHAADYILVGWGQWGKHLDRGRKVLELLYAMGKVVYCLKKNRDGTPVHPLYQSYSREPFIFMWDAK